MNWALLMCDLAARALGLIGLLAAVVAINVTTKSWVAGSDKFTVLAISSMIVLLMTLVFLLPSLHDRVLRLSQSMGARLLFILISFVWLLLTFAAIRNGFQLPNGIFTQYLPPSLGLWVTVLLFSLYLVFFFPVGASFRVAQQYLLEDKDTLSESAASEQHSTRDRDIWDFIVDSLLAAAILLLFFPKFLGGIAATGAWDTWTQEHLPLALLLTFALLIFPAIARTLFRKPLKRKLAIGPNLTILAMFAGAVIITLPALYILDNFFIPWAWNTLTENPSGVVEYTVIEVNSIKSYGTCIDATLVDDPGIDITTCGLDRYWLSRLSPGDIIRVTGELSWVGHSFEHIEVLSPE